MAKTKGTTMSEAQNSTPTEAPKKKRKAQGPRQTKPVFLVLRYTDEQGNAAKLDKTRLSVEHTKDPAQVIDLVTSGDNDATVVTIKIESEARQSPAAS
jgi:hypothetical protein